MRRNSLPISLRVSVWIRDNKQCHYCGKKLSKPGNKCSAITQVDHVIPHSAGGSDDADNLVICCKTCNRVKADTPYIVYIEKEFQRTSIQYKLLKLRLVNYGRVAKKSSNRTV
jgi:5-methylcytosine-specific restriction endonuclease McrA